MPIAHFIALCGLLFAGVTAALVQVQRYDQARCTTLTEQREKLTEQREELTEQREKLTEQRVEFERNLRLSASLRPSWWDERWSVRCRWHAQSTGWDRPPG